jgi:hypothetical protein
MPTQGEAELRGIFASAPRELGIKDVKYEGSNLRQVIREVLKDEYASLRKNRLTWSRGSEDDPRDRRFVVGELRKDGFPYIGPIGRGKYYIQNSTLYLSNGRKADIEKVSHDRWTYLNVDKVLTEELSDYERVQEAMASYTRVALAMDPNLCPYCALVSPKTRKDYMQHVYQEHPKEFLADAEGNEDTRLDIQAKRHGEEPVPLPTVEVPEKRPRARHQAE